ncbi:MAG: ComEA family DNA-binding protein [Gaiellaceae bacterium]
MAELFTHRRRALVAVFALVVVLALGGRLLARPSHANIPPPVRIAAPARTPAAAKLYVDVVGAVRRPGLYTLRDGSRVAAAVARAGGPTRQAQLELVNLAARVADGEQVVVPRRGVAVAVAGGPAGAASAGPVHLNSATLEQLDTLPGVGPVTAQKILDYRQKHGAFGSVDELDAVPGIGPARLETLRDLVAP